MPPESRVDLTHQQLRQLMRETVEETLTKFGLETDDPIEVQKDFQHLRDWRVSMEEVRRKGLLAAVGVIVSGALGALWLGLKATVSH